MIALLWLWLWQSQNKRQEAYDLLASITTSQVPNRVGFATICNSRNRFSVTLPETNAGMRRPLNAMLFDPNC
jgi:hypothetical protein